MYNHANREATARAAWLARNQRLATDQQVDLGTAYHMALQAILRGHGAEQAWHTLACSLNIALILCEQGFCAGEIETIKQAQQALMSCKARADKRNRYAFSGDEARLVMAATTIHDDQISRATRAQVTAALREVHRRIESDEVFA